jgi:hypothetical protein
MIENLRIGAPVLASDGKRLGTLERVVVASAADGVRVTSLVVNPGFRDLGDLLSPGSVEKPRARTAPIEMVVGAEEDEIHLSGDAAAFDALPLFERREYVAAPEPPAGRRFRWGDIISYTAAAFGLGAAPYMPETEATTFNEAAGSAELPARAPVWRKEPHELIGHIERTLVESGAGRVTGFVMRRERMGGALVTLPAGAVIAIEDGVAHVALTDAGLDSLEPFKE